MGAPPFGEIFGAPLPRLVASRCSSPPVAPVQDARGHAAGGHASQMRCVVDVEQAASAAARSDGQADDVDGDEAGDELRGGEGDARKKDDAEPRVGPLDRNGRLQSGYARVSV